MHLNDIFAGLFGIAVLFQQAYQQFGHGRWQQTQQQQIQQTQQQLFQLAYNAPPPGTAGQPQQPTVAGQGVATL